MPHRRARRVGARIPAAVLAGMFTVLLAGCGGSVEEVRVRASGKASAMRSPPSSTPTPSPRTPTPPPTFDATIDRVERDMVPHSWRSGCPVPLAKLRLLRMMYWGFDGEAHTGEMVVHARVARDIVGVFRTLYEERFAIRKMRLIDEYGGDDFRSVDDDNTSAFNCRTVAGTNRMSMHAYGLAIDLNPCENPYVAADGSVSHPQCRRYVNRDRDAKGMVHDGGTTVTAFAAIGWKWGGSWSGAVDYQHFSSNGR